MITSFLTNQQRRLHRRPAFSTYFLTPIVVTVLAGLATYHQTSRAQTLGDLFRGIGNAIDKITVPQSESSAGENNQSSANVSESTHELSPILSRWSATNCEQSYTEYKFENDLLIGEMYQLSGDRVSLRLKTVFESYRREGNDFVLEGKKTNLTNGQQWEEKLTLRVSDSGETMRMWNTQYVHQGTWREVNRDGVTLSTGRETLSRRRCSSSLGESSPIPPQVNDPSNAKTDEAVRSISRSFGVKGYTLGKMRPSSQRCSQLRVKNSVYDLCTSQDTLMGVPMLVESLYAKQKGLVFVKFKQNSAALTDLAAKHGTTFTEQLLASGKNVFGKSLGINDYPAAMNMLVDAVSKSAGMPTKSTKITQEMYTTYVSTLTENLRKGADRTCGASAMCRLRLETAIKEIPASLKRSCGDCNVDGYEVNWNNDLYRIKLTAGVPALDASPYTLYTISLEYGDNSIAGEFSTRKPPNASSGESSSDPILNVEKQQARTNSDRVNRDY